jgi:Uma2 family endonuclease
MSMNSAQTASGLMTAEQFFDHANRPENQGKHLELVRGKVVEMSRPGERHCHVCGNVVWVLNNFVRQRRRGRVLANDPGILLERDPDTVRGPDVVFFDDVKPYDQLNPKFAEGIPPMVVEVLSPNDRVGKVTRRIGEYLRAGIKLIWIVDPEAQDVTVHRPRQESEVFEGDQELTGYDVLPGLSCRLSDVFFVAGEERG